MDNLIDMIEDGSIKCAIEMVKENWDNQHVVGFIEHTVTDQYEVSTTPLLATLNTFMNPYARLTKKDIELALLLIATNKSNAGHPGFIRWFTEDNEVEVSKTALIIAIEKNCPEIVTALIQSGQSNVEFVDELGMTALLIASVYNNIHAVKQILEVTPPSYWMYKNPILNTNAFRFNNTVKKMIQKKKKQLITDNVQAERVCNNSKLPLETMAEIKSYLNYGNVHTNFTKICQSNRYKI